MNKNIVKWVLIFGGGFLGFTLLKPKKKELLKANEASVDKSFDSNYSDVKPSKENAEIVAAAYGAAIQANEPSNKLNELNKECMKEYGMRCYMDKNSKLIVCDVSGNVILSK